MTGMLPTMIRLLLGAHVAACLSTACSSGGAVPAVDKEHPEGTAAARASLEVHAVNVCILAPRRVQVRIALPVRYLRGAGVGLPDGTVSRRFFSFDCWPEAGGCTDGIEFELDGVDEKQLIRFHDISIVKGAKVSTSGSLTEISWNVDPAQVLAIDFEQGMARYSETSAGATGPIEGRGETKCSVDREGS